MISIEELLDSCPEVEENYRQLHQIPELGFEEFETSAFIMEKLASYGISATQMAVTGVVATIHGCAPGKTVALRADMDALSVTETAEVPYPSRHPGRMHACGHDAHVAMLLGAARYFQAHRHTFSGSVRLIFQPAEEGVNREKRAAVEALGGSGEGGAASLIRLGALEGVDACFALHVFANLPTGTLSVSRERAMASCDMFELDICGRGGHGSAPEHAIDPVGALAEILAAYQAFPARELSPLETCVLSIGVIRTDCSWNVIPDRIRVEGGVRAFDLVLRQYTLERLPQIAAGICAAHRCTADFRHVFGVGPTINDPALSQRMVQVANRTLGAGCGRLLEQPLMVSEDVGYYFRQVPGAIGLLGCMGADMEEMAQHNPNFRVDLQALRLGVQLHVNLALDVLSEEGG